MIIKKNKTQKDVLPENNAETQDVAVSKNEKMSKTEEIDLFNLDNIDFKQRSERRRGDRRRGFRRIDDRNLISRAREEAESIREAAAKEGYQEGINKAQDDIQSFKQELQNFMNAKQEVFNEIMPEILKISIDIAKKIIKKEVSESNDTLLLNIDEILKSFSKDETKITIRVNPSQAGILKTEVPEKANGIGLEAKILIIPDETITEGGCIISTTNGVVDATIETQLAIISEALKEV